MSTSRRRGRRQVLRAGLATVPGDQPARFAGYDVLDQADRWDDATTGVVMGRLGPPPPLRFFTVDEERLGRPLVDRLLAQEDGPHIAVLEMIDARLAEAQTDGWHYDTMPDDGEAWRQSLAALEAHAQQGAGGSFSDLDVGQQNEVLESVRTHDGDWYGLPANRVWNLWTRYACTAFYSHPLAWNEIGFGGPAYPRGYKNAGLDKREPWEVPEIDAHDPLPWAQRVEAAKGRHR